ncbi:Mov34/MPN/PAD-1 family protein [Dryocola clanedunensis]
MNRDQIVILGTGFQLLVHQKVYCTWEAYRQIDKTAPEAFGILIGGKSLDNEQYKLVEITEPKAGDLCSRTHFILKDPGHQFIVNQRHVDSKGELAYLGTWHTHPEDVPYASMTDIDDWKKCVKRNLDRQLFFVIVGLKKMVLYYYNENGLNRIEF